MNEEKRKKLDKEFKALITKHFGKKATAVCYATNYDLESIFSFYMGDTREMDTMYYAFTKTILGHKDLLQQEIGKAMDQNRNLKNGCV